MTDTAKFMAWVKARVRIDENGCWVWTNAMHGGTQPRGRYDGEPVNVRREIVSAAGPIPRGWWALPVCETPGCVCPAHLKAQSRSAATKGRVLTIAHKAKLAAAAQARSRLTAEDVEMVRFGPGTPKEKAQRLGIDPRYAREIIRGGYWRDYSSPFAGLGARP